MISCEEFIEQMSNYLDGDVDADWSRKIVEHCHQCAPCNVVLDTTRKTIRLFSNDAYFEMPLPVSERLHAALDRKLRAVTEGKPITEEVLPPERSSSLASRLASWFRPARMALASGAVAAVLLLGYLAVSGTTVYGWLIDAHCAKTFHGKEAAQHPVGCNLGPVCRDAGWGVMTATGEYLKFDRAGDQRALNILNTTHLNSDLEVRVTGRREGDEFVVRRLAVVSAQQAQRAQVDPPPMLVFASW